MSSKSKKAISLFLLIALVVFAIVGCSPANNTAGDNDTAGNNTAEENNSGNMTENTEEPAAEDSGETVDAGDETEMEAGSTVFIGTNGMTGKHYNPLWLTSNPQFLTFPLILPALTWFDNNVQPIPDLATDIDVSEDATVYTFYLPEDAVWSDGEPLTADDVYFTYKLAVTPDLGQSVWSTNYATVKGVAEFRAGEAEEIEGIQVVDDHTVVFELTAPNAAFLFNTYLGILPEHILGSLSVEELELSDYVDAPTVTSGPYDFIEFVEDQYIQFEKKADYWGKQVQIDEIFVEMFESNATLLAQLEAGEIDIASIAAEEVARFSQLDNLSVLSVDGIGYLVAHVDARSQEDIDKMNLPSDQGGKGGNAISGEPIERVIKPYMQEVSFRQALAYAIDSNAIINVLADGEAKPIYSPIFGPEWAVNPDLNTYDRDLDTAKSMMEEAGVTFSENGTAMYDDEAIVLVFLSSSSEQARRLGELLQQQLGEVGIRVDIKLVTSSAFIGAAIAGEGDLILNGGGRFGADPSVSSQYYTCAAGWAELVMGYCNPAFDELMAAGVETSVIEDRQAIYWEASQILNTELPSLFFMSSNAFFGASNNLSGVDPSVDPGYLTWNIEEWTITE